MVTSGSTGSTTHVPVMPRAKGFCITTHKQTQEARKKQLFLLVHLRGNKKAAAFNSALPCALDITRSPKWPRSGKKSAALPGALFLVAISSASSTKKGRRRPQKTWFIRMAIATKTTEFLLLPTCSTPTTDDALPICPTPTADDALPTCYTPTTDDVLPTCYTPTTDDAPSPFVRALVTVHDLYLRE